MKLCTRCNSLLNLNCFAADSRHADGLQSQCNSCRGARAALTRQNRLNLHGKICKTCSSSKSINEFSTYEGDRGKMYYYDCNSCRLILSRCKICKQVKEKNCFEILSFYRKIILRVHLIQKFVYNWILHPYVFIKIPKICTYWLKICKICIICIYS